MTAGLIDPVHIVEHLFEVTKDGLLLGDYPLFRDCFSLPYTYDTFENRRVVSTEADFRMLYDDVSTSYRIKGVTDLVRKCLSVEFRGEDTIEAAYETRILAGVDQISGPLPMLSVYRRIQGEWKIVSGQYGIDTHQPHGRAFVERSQRLK